MLECYVLHFRLSGDGYLRLYHKSYSKAVLSSFGGPEIRRASNRQSTLNPEWRNQYFKKGLAWSIGQMPPPPRKADARECWTC